jgi:hypothetical protein
VKVKQKRTAADYLAEQGYADLPDAKDPEEDDDDTEVQSDPEDDEEEPPRVPVQRPVHGRPARWSYWAPCPGGCGIRHKCLQCSRKVIATFRRPCPWESQDRLCEPCFDGPSSYDGSDRDEYYDA